MGIKSLVLWVLLLISNNLLLPVMSSTTNTNLGFENEKNYYPSPSGFHSNPSNHGSNGGTTIHPHHGSHHGSSGGGQSNCGTPPTVTPPTHSGGSGGHYYPTPSPTPPSGGGGGGHYHPTPKPTPTPPSHGGGGCACPSPPPTRGGSGGGGGYYPPTPTTPVVVTPPSTPLVPSPPYVTPVTPIVPSPPLIPVTPPTPFDPNTPPFPCTYWGTHPTLIFGVLGWWATVGGLFGVTTLPGLNAADYSLQQILTSPRKDGYGSLYREGTASLLNSMATKNFIFSTKQVKDSFLNSLSSDKLAATQARLFKLANEGRSKHIRVAVSTTTTVAASKANP